MNYLAELAEEMADLDTKSESLDSSETFSIPAIDSKSMENSKIPAIKDLEPAIRELLAAHRLRDERQSKFERPFIDEDDIPQYIAFVVSEIRHRLRAMTYQPYEVGGLLYIIKRLLPRGKFIDWIEENLSVSKSTALNCMRVYRCCLGHPGIFEYFKKSALYQICAPSFPPDFRRFIFQNIDGPLDAKKAGLLEIAIKWKNGEVTPKSPEVRKLLKKHRFESEAKKYIDELKNVEKFLKSSANKILALNRVNDPHPYLSEDDNDKKDARFHEIEKMVSGYVGEISAIIKDLETNR